MYLIRKLILITCLLFVGISAANDVLLKPNSDLFSQPQFLPIEQAYHLSVTGDGQSVNLAWQLAEGYYLYRHQFAFKDQQFNALDLKSSYSREGRQVFDEFFNETLEVFYGNVEIKLDRSSLSEEAFIVVSQACADAGLCYPPRQQLVTVKDGIFSVQESAVGGNALDSAASNGAHSLQSLGLILLFAFVGGLILNLMPCVFPILSIKVLSLTSHHESRSRKLTHGVVYALGVVLSFIAVASVMLSLRAAGQSVGWGFQLQSPLMVGVLIYVFVLMGLSLTGAFTFGASLMNFGQSSTQDVSLKSSFMAGVLATVVASPCTAPFMGTALGFALAQSVSVSLLVFAMLGLGMALPVVLLAAWPKLAQLLPKPGRWMEVLKQLLAFPLYLSAVWLLWVLGHQVGTDVMAGVLVGLVLLVFSIWLFGISERSLGKLMAGVFLIASIVLPWQAYLESADQQAKSWSAFSAAQLQRLLDKNQPVFVNVTADWCITCLANERLVLSSSAVEQAFDDYGVTYLKADWTSYDASITQFLNKHQRSGVPLYLYYSNNSADPIVLPQILTKDIILSAVGGK